MSQSQVPEEFFQDLLSDFLDEAGRLLDRLNENLLKLDRRAAACPAEAGRCDERLINDMFRAAHSLKGLSAMFGLRNINHLTHKIENVLDAVRRGELEITPPVVQVIFRGVDLLQNLVAGRKFADPPQVDCRQVLAEIQCILDDAGASREATSPCDAERALEEALSAVARAAAEDSPTSDPSSPHLGESRLGAAGVSSADSMQGIVDDVEASTKYLAMFIDETDLALDSLTETLLTLENKVSAAALESLLITSHRIKGSAASVGFHRAARLAHFMEDVLDRLRRFGGKINPELADALLKCTDALRAYLHRLRTGTSGPDEFQAAATALLGADGNSAPTDSSAVDRFAKLTLPSGAKGASAASVQPAEAGWNAGFASAAAEAPLHMPGFVGSAWLQAGLPLAGLKARLAYEKLCRLGDVFFCEPNPQSLDELEHLDRLTFGVATHFERRRVEECLRIGGVERTELHALETLSSSSSNPAEGTPFPAGTTRIAEAAACLETAASPQSGKAADRFQVDTEPKETSSADADIAHGSYPSEAAGSASSREALSRPVETIRVDIERLDQLMKLSGQLVIHQARFARIAESLQHLTGSRRTSQTVANALSTLQVAGEELDTMRGAASDAQLDDASRKVRTARADLEGVRQQLDQLGSVRGTIGELQEAVHQLGRVSDGIQRSVISTRMAPIGPLFNRFRRVVRDITRLNGKDIRLEIHGEQTELDKRMIDELGDPLIHLVRNAADHGVEPPEVRVAAGKPPQGTIALNAFHRGNHIVIQVRDDGRGLDPVRIRHKAQQRGLLPTSDAERVSTQQIYQLVWEPGLSTAEQVTEISGRGMGMDIVKSKIEGINGLVELDSLPGQGTQITIKLPLTLAILPSLLAEIDGDVYALPMEAVREIVRVGPSDVRTVHGSPTARIGQRIVPVLELSEVLDWSVRPPVRISTPGDDTTLVLLGHEGQEMGLAVDKLLGEENLVIQSIAENYRHVQGVAGASVLSDGRVSLILDVAALFDRATWTVSDSSVRRGAKP